MTYFYISFATAEEFLGATVVDGKDPEDAVREASRRGVNPGGEAAIFGLGDDFDPDDPDHKPFLNRLVEKEEMITKHGGVRHGDMDPETYATLESLGIVISEEQNKN